MKIEIGRLREIKEEKGGTKERKIENRNLSYDIL